MRQYIFKTLILFCILVPISLLGQDTVNLSEAGARPFLMVYKPPDAKYASQIAVIVCYGGSYRGTADEEEGIPAAKMLAANGIVAFLLDYRVPYGKDSMPLKDAQVAIRYVREHAKNYHIIPDKIGIMGFSAGGHLVSTIGTHWKNNYENIRNATSSRPDFMVLIYPVISFADSLTHAESRSNFLGSNITPERIRRYSNELQVSDNVPPPHLLWQQSMTMLYVLKIAYILKRH